MAKQRKRPPRSGSPQRPPVRVSPKTSRHWLTLALVVAAVILLAGGFVLGYLMHQPPGVETSLKRLGSAASAPGNNQADVLFAEMLAAHDQQAATMAKLAETKGHAHDVQDVGFKIEFAMQTEYDTASGWLNDDWTVSQATTPNHVAGMASAAEIKALTGQTGPTFDATFVRLMIRSDEGAIALASTELAKGKSAEAVGLASSLLVSQTAEINRLKAFKA